MKDFGIEVAVAASGQLNTSLDLPGAVAANGDRLAHVVPHLAGVVREVRKNLGDSVKQGELMAVIESRALADAKAEYLAATEKVQLARAKFSREERLWQKKISAEQEYLDARQSLAEARIAVRSAEQKLHALGFSDAYLKDLPRHHDMSYTRYEVVAPFNGTVIDKHITLGEVLKEDAAAFVVADLTTVWINLNVYQKDLPLIQKGQKAIISAGFGIPDAEGAIRYVAPIIKEETRTTLARVILPNPEGLWRPGTFVTAKVAVDASTAPIVIPKSALQNMDEKPVIFVQDEDGFETRAVTTGRATEDVVEIISGLSNGDRYVSKGSFTLKAQLSKGAFGHGHAH
jgi:cobalt-zinc-cadmium efflux system membrane fusion protein